MKLVLLFMVVFSSQLAFSQTPTPTPKPADAMLQAVKAQNAKAIQMNAFITQYNTAIQAKD